MTENVRITVPFAILFAEYVYRRCPNVDPTVFLMIIVPGLEMEPQSVIWDKIGVWYPYPIVVALVMKILTAEVPPMTPTVVSMASVHP